MLELLHQRGKEKLERWDFFKNLPQVSFGGIITAR